MRIINSTKTDYEYDDFRLQKKLNISVHGQYDKLNGIFPDVVQGPLSLCVVNSILKWNIVPRPT